MLFKRAWLRCCAGKTVDEILALSLAMEIGGSHSLHSLSSAQSDIRSSAVPLSPAVLYRRRSANDVQSLSLVGVNQEEVLKSLRTNL